MTALEQLLEALWSGAGSDLMLTPGCGAAAAGGRGLTRLEGRRRWSPADTEAILLAMLNEKQAADFAARREIDFSFSWRDRARFRGNGFRQRGTVALALRLIPYDAPDLDELGLPRVVRSFAELPQGLVLVTGPTGSGKSTTLASLDRPHQPRRGRATSSPSRTRSSTCTATRWPR